MLKLSIVAVSAALGFVETLLVWTDFLLYVLVLPGLGIEPTAVNFGLVSTSASLASLVIDPVVVFLAMFWIGRGADLRSEYTSVVVSLAVGTLAGTYGSLFVIGALSTFAGRLATFLSFIQVELVFDGIGAVRMALVGFAGFALAYFASHGSPSRSQDVPA